MSTLLAAGYAAERSVDAVLSWDESHAWTPTPALPGDSLRERYRVRMNGVPMGLARFASRHAPQEVGKSPDLALLHGDGAGGTVYWKADAPRIPLEQGAPEDPVGFPGARALLSGLSDRPDHLSSALYACSPESLQAFINQLTADGWERTELRGGWLFARGSETLLVEPGPPGGTLVYWRAP